MAADYGLLAPAWLLALPLVAALTLWLRRRGRTLPPAVAPLSVRHPAATHALGPVVDRGSGRRDWLLPTALTLLVVALAEPVRHGPALAGDESGTTLMLLVDVSVSMVIADYALDGERIDRLTMAKRLIDGFVASLDGERVGLVVVGSPSALWVPPTRDHTLLRQALSRLELTLAGRNAAIGDALVLTAEHLRDSPQRVAVLVSDGNGWVGRHTPEAGAERLRAAGVTLYAIGIGATGSGRTERRHGDLIYEPADMALLERVAQITGGTAFHATDSGAMAEILATIRTRHPKPQPPAGGPRLARPLYPWPLGAALLLLAALPWLPARGASRGARG
jgi:Ca-activated chloride channel family protein